MIRRTLFALSAVSLLLVSPLTLAEVAGIKDGRQILQEVAPGVKNISTDELVKEIDSNPDLVLIDIRTVREIENMGGAIDATQNTTIPRGWLEFRAGKVATSKDAPIVVVISVAH